MLIAIDLDGPVRQLIPKLVEVYNREYRDDFRIEEITEYHLGNSFPIGNDIYQLLFKDFVQEIYLEAEPEPGAIEAIHELKEWHQLFILTSQPAGIQEHLSRVWLERHEINLPVTFAGGKPKSEFRFDLLIDDCVEHLRGGQEKGRKVICYRQPWNHEWPDKRMDWFKIQEVLSYEWH